ncbi:hypothetical protein Hdeb2414_s0015g00442091 [Helianthus debilis subsp. tardiflorus]
MAQYIKQITNLVRSQHLVRLSWVVRSGLGLEAQQLRTLPLVRLVMPCAIRISPAQHVKWLVRSKGSCATGDPLCDRVCANGLSLV